MKKNTFIVYEYTNVTNGKKFVGVTDKNTEECWRVFTKRANDLRIALGITNQEICDATLKKRAYKLLSNKVGQIEYDIAVSGGDFKCEILLTTENLFTAARECEARIKEMSTVIPLGYNTSDVVMLSFSVSCDDIQRWVFEHVAKLQQIANAQAVQN
jgi:hypothetical protein